MSDILVVKTEGLAPWIQGRYGLITGCGEEILAFAEREHEFLPRPQMETDPSYRQIIPYVAVTRGDEIFAMRRLNKGGEARLHGKISLGAGGHIERADDDKREGILMRALEREVSEEVSVENVVSLTPLGVINEEGDEVSRVHLGFLFRMEVKGEVAVRETEKLSGEWIKISDLPAYSEEMEGWSRIAMEAVMYGRGVFTPADILLPQECADMENGAVSPATSSQAIRSTGPARTRWWEARRARSGSYCRRRTLGKWTRPPSSRRYMPRWIVM